MKILFIDDDPENVKAVADILRDALDAGVLVATSVTEAVAAFQRDRYDIVVTDIFIPLGNEAAVGPRARRWSEHIEHLGGLVLLDELERLDPIPRLLIHTACNDPVMLEIAGQRAWGRVPKPAPVDRLLNAILDIIHDR